MVPLPLYIAHFQPNSLAGWTDFRQETAVALGYGADSTLWTANESSEINRAIQETYRYIQQAALWSWKRARGTLTTVDGTATYTMPADFGSIMGDITYAADAGFTWIKITSALEIRKRNQQSSSTAQPWLYATQWAAQVAGSNQRQEIVLYPTPDDAYTLTYEYAVLMGPLSETNPYPLGGPNTSQLMIEGCRAVGEKMKNGQRGDYWSVFELSLAAASMLDRSTLTERTVGSMGDPDGRWTNYGVRSTSGSTYSGIG